MSLTDVCRLCLAKEDLVWVFDKRFENTENMKDVIYVTTGVEIHLKDLITQKICQKCCKVTIRMYQFRSTALKNDKALQDQCKDFMKDWSIKTNDSEDKKLWQPSVKPEEEKIKPLQNSPPQLIFLKHLSIKRDTEASVKPDGEKIKPLQDLPSKPTFVIHPSVKDLFLKYPQIKLPTQCLKNHIDPFVSMQMEEVENYFKKKKLDFAKYTKIALKSVQIRKVATKKTSSPQLESNSSKGSATKKFTAVINNTGIKDQNIIKLKMPFARKCVSNLTGISNNTKENDISINNLNEFINNFNKELGSVNCTKSIKKASNQLSTTTKHSEHVNFIEPTPVEKPKPKLAEKPTVAKKRKLADNSDTPKVPNKRALMDVLELAPKNSHNLMKSDINEPKDGNSITKSEANKPKCSQSSIKAVVKTIKPSHIAQTSDFGKGSNSTSPKSTLDASMATEQSPVSLSIIDKSVPLYICEICNSVQYNAKDLRKHQNKHMRCQFCKMHFRSLDSKTRHIKNACIIKNTMQNLPTINLKRIEFNKKIRRKYPEAFKDFPPLKKRNKLLDDSAEGKNTTIKTKNETSTSPSSIPAAKSARQITTEKTVDIIEILSDDEEIPAEAASKDTTPRTSSSTSNIPSETSVTPSTSDSSETISKTSVKCDNINKKKSKVPKAVPVAKTVSVNKAFPVLNVIPSDYGPIPENIVYNTVSIVKPDIKIKNSNWLDNVDPKTSDIKMLKDILHKYNSSTTVSTVRTETNTATINLQTDFPKNSSITINRKELTTEMKALKQQLHVYKIPVEMQFGEFKAYYTYHTPPQLPKKLSLWKDLEPTDVKQPQQNVLKENQQQVVLPSNANHNSTIVYSPLSQPSSATSNNFQLSNLSNATSSNSSSMTSSRVQNQGNISVFKAPTSTLSSKNSFKPNSLVRTTFNQNVNSASSASPKISTVPASVVSNNSCLSRMTSNANTQVKDIITGNPLLNNFLQNASPTNAVSNTIPLSTSDSLNSSYGFNTPYSNNFNPTPTLNYPQTQFLEPATSQTISCPTITLPGISSASNLIPMQALASNSAVPIQTDLTTGNLTSNQMAGMSTANTVSSIQTNLSTTVNNVNQFPSGLIRVRDMWELT